MTETWLQVSTILGSNLLIMLTFFGIIIAFHLSAKVEIKAIYNKKKDFHEHLEIQDVEFKEIEKKDTKGLIYHRNKK